MVCPGILLDCQQGSEKKPVLDCGPQTSALYAATIRASKAIFWNGPMGASEMKKFEAGTRQMMNEVVAATAAGAKLQRPPTKFFPLNHLSQHIIIPHCFDAQKNES